MVKNHQHGAIGVIKHGFGGADAEHGMRIKQTDGVYRTPILKNKIPEPEPATSVQTESSALAPAHVDGRLLCRLAVDIGGTFTDAVLEDGDEIVKRHAVKVLTTPQDPAKGFVHAAMKALGTAGRNPEQVRLILHGTTLATNAILERNGARTAMITTAGFKDILDVASGGRCDSHDLRSSRTSPLVPRHLRFEVRQRLRADGSEEIPLDEVGLAGLAPQLRSEGIESLAICFLNSHMNDLHEERAVSILRPLLPDVRLCTSHGVSPEIREYERFSTATANAYVQPLISKYLKEAESLLQQKGFRCPLLLMTSGGGLVDSDTAAALPIRLVESGPAGGVTLAQHVAREVDVSELLSLDMGGTTAKVCAISNGHAAVARQFEVDRAERFIKGSGLPVRIPCLDLVEISGGGGSIASMDAVGSLKVGPHSAGSEPGPACYGRGGVKATVTDSDLVLGRIESGAFAAGEVNLKSDNATDALRKDVQEPLGLASSFLAAQAVAEAVEESLATAARAHAAEHGLVLSRHALVALGGAAPLRAAHLAERLGLRKVLIPPDASVGSAIGFLSAPLAFEALRSRPMKLLEGKFDCKEINAVYRELWHQTIGVVALGSARWKPGRPAKERRRAYGRYVGQGWEIGIDLPNRDFVQDDLAEIQRRFEDAYKKVFSRTVPGAVVEIRSWALGVVADSDPLTWARERFEQSRKKARTCHAPDEVKQPDVPSVHHRRKTYCTKSNSLVEIPVYKRDNLPGGSRIPGPAIIEEAYTTTIVTHSFDCVVLENGFLQLETRKDQSVPEQSLSPLQLHMNHEDILEAGLHNAAQLKKPGASSLQLAWSSLLAAVEEQAELMSRAAFSPLAREAGAVSFAIFDASGRLIAQNSKATPSLCGLTCSFVRSLLLGKHVASLKEGDTLLGNGLWCSAGRSSDLAALTPILLPTAALLGFIVTATHTSSLDLTQDGQSVTWPAFLSRSGNICQGLLSCLQGTAEQHGDCAGDAITLLTSNELGVRRILELLSRHHVEFTALADYACMASKNAILQKSQEMLGSGEWQHQIVARTAGSEKGEHAVTLTAKLKTSPGGMICLSLDAMSTTPGEFANAIAGSTHASSVAFAQFALFCVLGQGIPANGGVLSTLTVEVTPGSLLDSKPTCHSHDSSMLAYLIPDVIFGCLATKLPSNVPAASSSVLFRLDISTKTSNDKSGASSITTSCHVEGGGLGGIAGQDGLSATVFPSSLQSTPLEVTEAVCPVMFRKKELVADSGGPGRNRGGLGLRLALEPAGDEAVSVRFTHGLSSGPHGAFGGFPGKQAAACVSSNDAVQTLDFQRLSKGQPFTFETSGGGGFGPPAERARAAVLADIRDGFVSSKAAVQDYGFSESDV